VPVTILEMPNGCEITGRLIGSDFHESKEDSLKTYITHWKLLGARPKLK
jgi:hypothetical protein